MNCARYKKQSLSYWIGLISFKEKKQCKSRDWNCAKLSVLVFFFLMLVAQVCRIKPEWVILSFQWWFSAEGLVGQCWHCAEGHSLSCLLRSHWDSSAFPLYREFSHFTCSIKSYFQLWPLPHCSSWLTRGRLQEWCRALKITAILHHHSTLIIYTSENSR